jgi:hypothetical protein
VAVEHVVDVHRVRHAKIMRARGPAPPARQPQLPQRPAPGGGRGGGPDLSAKRVWRMLW